jgi:hypothetical protein
MMGLEQQRAHYRAVRARIAGMRPAPPPPAPRQALPPDPPPPPPPDPVARLPVSDRTRQSLRHVLTAYGATWDDVTGPAHHARTVTMRRAVYWLMHCNGFSLSRIGALTHRDHTSILHGLKKVNSWTPKQS